MPLLRGRSTLQIWKDQKRQTTLLLHVVRTAVHATCTKNHAHKETCLPGVRKAYARIQKRDGFYPIQVLRLSTLQNVFENSNEEGVSE